MNKYTYPNKAFVNPHFISLPKKDEISLLKDWRHTIEFIMKDFDTNLSPSAYKRLQQTIFEISKKIRECTKDG